MNSSTPDTLPTARWLALLAVTAAAVYLCWLIVQPFVDVILWATVMAIVIYPVHRRLVERGQRPSVAAAVTTILAVLVLLIPILFIGGLLYQEVEGLAPRIKSGLAYLADPESRFQQFVGRYVDLSRFRDSGAMAQRVEQVVGAILERSSGIVGGAAGVVIKFFFVVFTLFFLLRDADRVLLAVRRFLPLDADQADALLARAKEVTFASVAGVVLVAALQAALGGLMFWVLGVPSALLWTVVMFFTAMIPIGGATLVWVPASLYLAIDGEWIRAIILAGWGTLVVSMADNVLRPRLVGRRTRLHELVVLFSVLGGLQVFGILGLFVGPAVVATTLLLIDAYRLASPATVEIKATAPTTVDSAAEVAGGQHTGLS